MTRAIGSAAFAGSRRQNLRTHFRMRLPRRQFLDRRGQPRADVAVVARAPHHPPTHIGIGMPQQLGRELVAQPAQHVERAHGIERVRVVRIAREFLQFRDHARFPAPAELQRRLPAEPAVRVPEVF
jgi:hypothetical protein